MNKFLVKVCGITSQDNLKEIICDLNDIGEIPDLIGFIIAKESKRYITQNKAIELSELLPKEISKVLVSVNSAFEELTSYLRDKSFTHVQLHGDEDIDYVKKLKQSCPQILILKAVQVDKAYDFNDLVGYEGFVDYFLFDAKGLQRGGNGEKFSWNILENYNLLTPFFISGGIRLEDADLVKKQISLTPKLIGVDINSGFEISAGIKDAKQIRSFIKKLNDNN